MTDFSSSGCFSVAIFRCFSSCDLLTTLSIVLVVGESVCLRPRRRTVAVELNRQVVAVIIKKKRKKKEAEEDRREERVVTHKGSSSIGPVSSSRQGVSCLNIP